MDVAGAESLFVELAASISGVEVSVGIEGDPPHRYAYLKVTSRSDPDDFVMVSSVGNPWHMLEVPGGFYDLVIREDLDNQEVRELLERYLRAATAYLRGHRSAGSTKLLRVPIVTVDTVDGPLVLRLRVREQFKRVFGLYAGKSSL